MMEHKAFLFDWQRFEKELLPILNDALASGNCASIISFIKQNIESLTDPYEGEPLDSNWESLVETTDAHQYGDFALTKYYDPLADIGLGATWESVQALVAENRSTSPILGTVVGPPENAFDPGKIGAYFQSNEQVKESLEYLQGLSGSNEVIEEAIELLEQATQNSKGLYVTF